MRRIHYIIALIVAVALAAVAAYVLSKYDFSVRVVDYDAASVVVADSR